MWYNEKNILGGSMCANLLNSAGIDGATIVDLVVVAIFLIFAVIGIAKGFTRKLFRSYGKIIAFILTAVLCGKFAIWLNDRFELVNSLSDLFAGWIPKLFGESATMPLEEFLTGGAEEVSPLISGIVRQICDGISVDPSASIVDICAPVFAFYALQAVSFIGLFILFWLLFLIVGLILQKIVKSFKIITIVDKLLGMVFGLLEALVVIYIILFILSVLPFSFMETVNQMINASTLAKYFTEHNLIVTLGLVVNEIDFLREFLENKFPLEPAETALNCLKTAIF